MSTDAKALAVAAVAAPLALAVVTVVMLAAATAGRHPLWTPQRLNLTEAAAARDVATVAAMLERGEDAAVPQRVRPPLLDGLDRAVTPLEAGVLARRLEVVHVLLAHGTPVDQTTRDRLVCEARHNGDTGIADALAAGADVSCAP